MGGKAIPAKAVDASNVPASAQPREKRHAQWRWRTEGKQKKVRGRDGGGVGKNKENSKDFF